MPQKLQYCPSHWFYGVNKNNLLHKLCPFILRENWATKLKIVYLDDLDLQAFYKKAHDEDSHIVFSVRINVDLYVDDDDREQLSFERFSNQGPTFDFGDTMGTRFTSQLLKNHKSLVFGALYLPLNLKDPW